MALGRFRKITDKTPTYARATCVFRALI